MSTDVRSVESLGALRRTRSLGDLQPPRSSRRHRDRVRHSQHPLIVSEQQHPPILNRSQLVNSPSPTLHDTSNAGTSIGAMWAPPPVMMQHMEDAQAHHRGTHNPSNRPQRPHNLSWYSKILAFFGYGRGASHQRRLLVSLLWNLALGFAQFVVIVALLAVAAHNQSPTMPGVSEWTACARPLGIWCCLWIGRVALACVLTYWGWVRDRDIHQSPDDVEGSGAGNSAVVATPPSTSASPPRRQSTPNSTSSNRSSRNNSSDVRDNQPPRPLLYTRLSLLSSLVTLSWFLTAHILEYTSVNTCRFSSPHLWWLVFSILCLMYIMVLEVVLIGFVVFIIAPILFLFWNILLMCLGRHPLQNPGLIKPEIGKLPRSVVDRIPLVMYIPPSPEDSKSPITIPEAVYTYPPKESSKDTTPRRRFRFLRFSHKKSSASIGSDKSKNSSDTNGEKVADEPQSWEDQWEHCEYPFVKLEGNRAACAICLMDFEEPKRVNASGDTIPKDPGVTGEVGTPSPSVESPASSSNTRIAEQMSVVQEIAVESPSTEADKLKLTDAGDGAQPLRLLGCGHVFHKTCLDPWLTDVSGRCPVCQRPVEIPTPPKKKTPSRRRN